jgi:hypothetical protein
MTSPAKPSGLLARSGIEVNTSLDNMLLKYHTELAYPDRERTFSNRMFKPQEGDLVKMRKRL